MYEIKYRSPDEMKDSGVEWIGTIPQSWNIIRNKIIFNKSKDIVGRKSQNYSVLSLTLNGVVRRDVESNMGKMPKEWGQYQIVKKNDLLMCLFDIDVTPRTVGYVQELGIVSPAYSNYRKLAENINMKFFYYWYLNLDMRKMLLHLSKNLRNSISSTEFDKLKVILPSPSDQHKISNFLDLKTAQFDPIISKKELLIKKLEEAKKSLISEVVTGKVKIVDGKMVKRQPEDMKDSGVEWLGMIPRDWEIRRIKFLIYESTRRSISGKEEPLSMSQKYGLIKSSEMERIPNQSLSFRGNKKCTEGDLVFNKLKSHLGVFAVANQDGLVSPDYAVYKSHGKTSTKYLEYLFKTPMFINEFNKYSKGVGAGLTRLYTDDLFNIISIYPTLSEQFKMVYFIEDKVSDINHLIRKINNQIQKLKQAKQSLISEAVTGKIDLRDWEITQEGREQ